MSTTIPAAAPDPSDDPTNGTTGDSGTGRTEVDELWGAFLDDALDEQAHEAERQRLEDGLAQHTVTLVLVAHDGARWLPFTLAALADLDHAPDRVIAVDTGSTDATPALLEASLGSAGLLRAARDSGYGAAVAVGVSEIPSRAVPPGGVDVTDWLWLLHDDSAPESNVLRELLFEAQRTPAAAIIGPKVRGWRDGRLLLELGVTVGRGGLRETFLERGETDQGQHDQRKDVLAVGSAGMLVRRDVWDDLGGFATDLPMFRDDIDFCWRARRAGHRVVVAPAAVLHHAEAGARGHRVVDATGGSVEGADRRSALVLLLGNLRTRGLPWAYVRLTLGSIGRSLLMLVEKAPGAAAEEARAWAAVVGRPDRVHAARQRRSTPVTEPWSAVAPLLAPTGSHVRHGAEALLGAVGTGGSGSPSGGALESGPVSEDSDVMAPAGDGAVARFIRRPGVVLALALLLLSLLAFRGLTGRGVLQGGALLASPSGASDLWQAFVQPWHSVGVGSSLPGPPWIGVVSAFSVFTLAKPGLLVSLLFLLAVPFAGVSAYLLAGRLTTSRAVRWWGSAAYALLPAVTGGLAAGRLGTTILAWLLPLLVLAAMSVAPERGQEPTWRGVAGRGLLLSLAVAFVPVAWVAAAACFLAAGLAGSASRAWWAKVGVLVLLPIGVLAPWSLQLVAHPSRLLLEAGAAGPGLSDPSLPAWAVLLSSPGGPGVPATGITLGLLVAALGALLMAGRRRVVASAWLVALVGLLLGLLTVVVRVPVSSLGESVVPWPGVATLLIGGGMITAAAVGAEGVGQALSGRSFGWRQPLVALVVGLAVLAPAASAFGWLSRGVEGPLTRTSADVLPAFVAAESSTALRPSTLILTSRPGLPVSYTVLQGAGVALGDADVAPPAAAAGPLDDLVADLASGRAGDDIAGRLLTYGTAYVLVTPPAETSLVSGLDTAPGLERLAATDGSALWGVSGTPSRARVQSSDGAATPLPAGPVDVSGPVPGQPLDATETRVLALSNAADGGWRALVNGLPLDAVAAGQPFATDPPVPAYAGPSATWAQRFSLAPSGGQLELTYDGTARSRWLLAEAALVVALVITALPGRRRGIDDDEDPDAVLGIAHDPEPAPPAPEGVER